MSLDVGDVLREGVERTATRSGAVLAVAFAAVGLASMVARHSYVARVLATGGLPRAYRELLPPDPAPLAVDVSLGAALGLWVATSVSMEVVRVVGVRAMAADRTDRLRATVLTRRLGWTVVNAFLATLLVKLVVLVGLVLVVPGVFLAVSFLLVRQVVAVEDARLDEAIVRAPRLAAGHRWTLLLLAVVWAVGWLGLQFVAAVLGAAIAGGPAVTGVLAVAVTAPLMVFGVAVGTRAYVRLSGTESESGDDDEEWPDPPGVDV